MTDKITFSLDGRVARQLQSQDFPIVELPTNHQVEHWHTGWMIRRTNKLDAPKMNAGQDPKALHLLDIAADELISIARQREPIEFLARSDRAVAKGMIFIPFCYAEAAANILTKPQLDPYGKNPEFKFCATKVQKAARVIVAK